jgi:anti-sigma B factor antagonist
MVKLWSSHKESATTKILKEEDFCALLGGNLLLRFAMRTQAIGETLRIVGVTQIAAANAHAFRDWVRESLAAGQKNIEIDLSQTAFLDSCGLGALVELHKTACGRAGKLRLLNPQPPVQQILGLTRMDQIFEIVQS